MRSANTSHGLGAGLFSFQYEYGAIRSWLSFRVDITMSRAGKEKKHFFIYMA